MSGQDHLSATLRRLRKDAGLSGMEAASRAGLSQSKISRVETGAFMPTTEQVETLCRVYGAPAEIRRELVQLTHDIREEAASARVILQRGAWRIQQRIGRIESASSRIQSFQPTLVIGLLQTSDYTRALFGDSLPDGDVTQVVDARADRQRLLHSDREFTLVMTEGALRWHIGSPSIMVDQLEHLAEATHLPNARVGVIPWTTPARIPALHGFHLYDSRAVVIGTHTATAIITDERDIADYETYFAELEGLASYDVKARSVIHRITQDFRSLS